MNTPTNTPTPDHLSQVHGYNDEVRELFYSVREPEFNQSPANESKGVVCPERASCKSACSLWLR